MKIVCNNCGHTEAVNKRFFVKVIGAAMTGCGYWAWVAYLFAGTGFAMPICIAIMAGGVALAAFSDEIAGWVSKRYACPKCSSKSWKAEQ